MNKMVALAAAAGAVLLASAAPFKDGDRVVFFGDSITHGGFYGEYVNLFYATRYPERNIWFSNSGWSGATAPGVQASPARRSNSTFARTRRAGSGPNHLVS